MREFTPDVTSSDYVVLFTTASFADVSSTSSLIGVKPKKSLNKVR